VNPFDKFTKQRLERE